MTARLVYFAFQGNLLCYRRKRKTVETEAGALSTRASSYESGNEVAVSVLLLGSQSSRGTFPETRRRSEMRSPSSSRNYVYERRIRVLTPPTMERRVFPQYRLPFFFSSFFPLDFSHILPRRVVTNLSRYEFNQVRVFRTSIAELDQKFN